MKTNSLLRYGIYTGLALILLVPLLVASSMYFPFISGKNFAFRIVVEVIFALWLILAVREPVSRPRQTVLLWATASLLVVSILATVFSVNPYHSFWSNFERMDGLLTQIHLFMYFLVASSVLVTRTAWRNFFNWSLAVAVLVAVYATAQLFGWADIHQGASRLDASLGNSAYLAVYLLFHFFLATYLLVTMTLRNRLWQSAYLIVGLWFLILLYYTQTRGTIIGLVGGLFITGTLLAWRGSKRLKKIAVGVVLSLVVLLGLFIGFKDSAVIQSSETLRRLASISLQEQTVTSRFQIWQMSLEAVREKPILGWGQESFIYVFSKYYKPTLWNQEPWFDRSHNVFLDWLVSAGVLGLLAYLTLFGLAIYLLLRRDFFSHSSKADSQPEIFGSALLLGLLVAYLVHNFFVFDNLVSYILFFSLLAYLASIKAPEIGSRIGTSKSSPDWLSNSFVVVLVVLLPISLYWFNAKPIMANQNLIKAISNPSASDRLKAYQKVFTLETFASHEALEQYLNSANQLLDPNVSALDRETYSRLAVEQINAQSALAGPDARFNLAIGSFFTNVGRYDDALLYLNKAKEFSPTKQAVYFQLVSVYINKQNYDQAYNLAETARNLAPDYSEATLMSALVSIYSGHLDRAKTLLAQEKNKPSVIFDARLSSAYDFVKRPDQLAWLNSVRVDLYQQLIKTDPDNLANYNSLADLQIKMGNNFAAQTTLKLAIPIINKNITTDPGNKDNYLALANVYYRLGENDQVVATIERTVEYFNQLIKANPRLGENYLTLAEFFAQINRPDLARQVIDQGIKANSAFSIQAQKFLAQLPPVTK